MIICTHYDSDHLNGIIGMVKSKTLHINELWLPAIFGDIALTLSSEVDLILEALNCDDKIIDNEKKTETSILEFNNEKSLYLDINTYESLSIANLSYCSEILKKHWHWNFWAHKPYITQHILNKVITLIIESVKSGAHIRWLKYLNSRVENRINNAYDLFAINSCETSIVKYDKKILFMH